MGEAKRRRAEQEQEQEQERQTHTDRLNAEAGVPGARAWYMALVEPSDGENLLALASQIASGGSDAWTARNIVRATAQAVDQIARGDARPLCLFCDGPRFAPRHPPALWVVFFAMRDDPTAVMGHGICARCRGDAPREQLEERLVRFYQQHLNSSLRRIQVFSDAGGLV
jgi:hypothetical protein